MATGKRDPNQPEKFGKTLEDNVIESRNVMTILKVLTECKLPVRFQPSVPLDSAKNLFLKKEYSYNVEASSHPPLQGKKKKQGKRMEKTPNPQVLEDFFTKDFISPLKSTQ